MATAWDPAAQARALYREAPRPSHRTWGPRNRPELRVEAAEAGH